MDPVTTRTVIVRRLCSLALLPILEAGAVDYSGTVTFEGQVVFPVPIAGINAEDLEVRLKTSTDGTGSGEKCSILSTSSDNADPNASYTDAGTVSADILLERGGPQLPEGECIVTVLANGTDGVSVSARGSRTLLVTATEIDTSANILVPDITVRESKAIAVLEKECFKWVKKQLKKRASCNFLLLKKGSEGASKCKDGGPEPAGCDPGDHVEAILALSHGINDQQTDPPNAQSINRTLLKDQLKCQKFFGKAGVIYAIRRLNLVNKRCVRDLADSESCRDSQTQDAKDKLKFIDKCVGDQAADPNNGRLAPDVEPPCDVCIDGGGVIDRKCMKSCFEQAVAELSDGIIGDIAECGNGIEQPGEFCDDGNLDDGDGCSSICTVEAP